MNPMPSRVSRLCTFGAGVMLSLLAEQTLLFAVPLLIFQHTGSVAWSGLAFAVEWVPALLAYPFAGALADRLGGRRLFLVANAARALCLLAAVTACAWAPDASAGTLIFACALLSLFMAPVRVAVEKTVSVLAAGGPSAPLQTLVQNLELLARLLGPGLAAALAQALGKLPLLLAAAAAFVLAALTWRGTPTGRREPAHTHRVSAGVLLGWTLLWRNRPVRLLAGAAFTINLAFAVAVAANASVITGAFGASDQVFGLTNAAAGLCGLLALRLVPRLLGPWSIHRLGGTGYGVLCGGMAAMAWTSSVWVYASAFALSIGGAAWFNLFNRTQRVMAIEPEHLGKVIGVFYLVQYLPFPIAGALTAGLGPVLGVQTILQAMALVLALPGAVVMTLAAREFRRCCSGGLLQGHEPHTRTGAHR